MRINYPLLGRIMEIRNPKSSILNINWELWGKVVEAKKNRLCTLTTTELDNASITKN
jgi:hypothetical protein